MPTGTPTGSSPGGRRRRRPAVPRSPAPGVHSDPSPRPRAGDGARPRPDASRTGGSPAVESSPVMTTSRPAIAPPGFAALGVPRAIVDALGAAGVHAPFPIQAATLPDSLAGRDVLGRGQTGSGKTIAFAVPVVARLAAAARRPRSRRPRSMILVPTRELANQVFATIDPLASALGLRCTVVFGGVGQNPQVAAMERGVDVLVACPGRLEDLIRQGHCDLSEVEITVLDEADHMADLGFLPGVRRLMQRTPGAGQRLLFSATLDNGVDVLVREFLHQPVTHSVDPEVAPVATMTHHVLRVSAVDKPQVMRELAAGQDRSLLFTRTKHVAKKIAKQLTQSGIPAVELHGNLSQNARERNLAAFADGSCRVLVATDIAARGIHVDEVAVVVHVDPPAEHKAYLHRSGRTARAGAEGIVVTLMTPDQQRDVATLARHAKVEPIYTDVAPGHPQIAALVGAPAAYVAPPAPAAPARTSPGTRSRRPGAPAPRARSGTRSSGPSGSASASASSNRAPARRRRA